MSGPWGLSPQGFILKQLADILSGLQSNLAPFTDPVTGETFTPNLADENDPLVLIVNALADGLSVCWEQLQLVNNQYDPSNSTGAGLRGLVQLNAITGNAGTYSTVVVNLTGTPNFVMPSGAQCGTQDGTMTFNLPQITFDSSGNATGVIGTCTVLGPGPTAEPGGTVTMMVTPVTGWGSVTNPDPVAMGLAQETDEQLRARQQASTMSTALGPIDAIYGNLANIEGATYCRVYQNNTLSDAYDSVLNPNSLPAKTIAAVVVGGSPSDICNLLFKQSPMARWYANPATTINIVDAQGISYGVSYTIPSGIPIYVALTIHIIDSTAFPDDGATQIKNQIVSFGAGGMKALGITNVYDRGPYKPGEIAYSSDLYPAIMSVPGAQLVSAFIGLSAAPTGQSAAIDWNEQAEFLAANISVTEI